MACEEFLRRYWYEKHFKNAQLKHELILLIQNRVNSLKSDLLEKDNNRIRDFVYDLYKYWNGCRRIRSRFEEKYKMWLSKPIFPSNPQPATSNVRQEEFEDLSVSQKRRRTADLRTIDCGPLIFAATSKLREEGQASTSKILQRVIRSPETVKKALDAYDKQKLEPAKMNVEKALVTFLDCGATRRGYQHLRNTSKSQTTNQYPPYNDVLVAMKDCYPSNVQISELEALVPLQSLLDHTSTRFLAYLELSPSNERLKIFYKWGFDGCSSHSEYKMLFKDPSVKTDKSVLITTIVPLKIIDSNSNSVVWDNKSPSSTWHCRPLRIAFEKETTASVQKEYERVTSEIQNLTETRVTIQERDIQVEHQLFLTMLDGKSVNVIVGNAASSRCHICSAGPKLLNNLDLADVTNTNPNLEDKLKYGMSPLHARINTFEYLLHMSYRLALPKERRQKGLELTPEEKSLVKDRKSEIIRKLRNELGLIVDIAKPGFGSSNDGNTARKFFEKADKSAQILGIDKELIDRFATIISAVNISEELDANKYHEYALDTARLLLAKYSFWTMSPTVHKLLLHGKDIIENNLLPIGSLSEEALEHRNKDLKQFRGNHARRTSREDNLTDVFHRFFLTSDPLITHKRLLTRTKKEPTEVCPAVRALLRNPEEL